MRFLTMYEIGKGDRDRITWLINDSYPCLVCEILTVDAGNYKEGRKVVNELYNKKVFTSNFL